MKKYFLKKGHKEVKLGDTIEISTPAITSFGKGIAKVAIKLTEVNLDKLIHSGIIIAEAAPLKEIPGTSVKIDGNRISCEFDNSEEAKSAFSTLVEFFDRVLRDEE